jgi:hypothetical protein
MKLEVKEFLENMSKIDWQPRPAAFQISWNRKWARHSDWAFIPKEKKQRICEEVWKSWMLVPIVENGMYMFFGPPWERTRIVEFYPNSLQ